MFNLLKTIAMFFFKLKVVATWGGEGEFDLPKIESLFFGRGGEGWGGGGTTFFARKGGIKLKRGS